MAEEQRVCSMSEGFRCQMCSQTSGTEVGSRVRVLFVDMDQEERQCVEYSCKAKRVSGRRRKSELRDVPSLGPTTKNVRSRKPKGSLT